MKLNLNVNNCGLSAGRKKMESGKSYHICLDIEGTLKRSEKTLDGLLADDQGRRFTGAEVKAFLIEQRRKHGYTCYSGCDNMNSEGRCAGHSSAS